MKNGGSLALSVRQPWAEMIVSGRKPIELRSWQRSYRGRIWIHAGKQKNEALELLFGYGELFHGGYIGSAELTSIEYIDSRRWEAWREMHHDRGPFQPSLFAWVLARPRRLESPVPASGDVGLYTVPEETLHRLTEADRTELSRSINFHCFIVINLDDLGRFHCLARRAAERDLRLAQEPTFEECQAKERRQTALFQWISHRPPDKSSIGSPRRGLPSPEAKPDYPRQPRTSLRPLRSRTR